MILQELFSKTYRWEQHSDYREFFFHTDDGDEINVVFSEVSTNSDTWSVDFNRNGDFNMTGGGDAIKIMGTVIEILEISMKKHNPKAIVFSAKRSDHGRVKLYRRLAAKVASEMNYKLYLTDEIPVASARFFGKNDEIFYMEKK